MRMVTKAQQAAQEAAQQSEETPPDTTPETVPEVTETQPDVNDDDVLEPVATPPADPETPPEVEPSADAGTTDLPENSPDEVAADEAPAAPKSPPKPDLSQIFMEQFMPENMEDLVRSLWYGDPGVGKTTCMVALARVGKVVVVDPEKRLKRSALRRAGIPVDNIHHHTDVSYDGMNGLADRLEKALERGKRYAGVCWDAATESQRLFIMQQVDSGVAEAASKGMERSSFRIYQDDYGDVGEMMRRVLRRFTALPLHLGMTALAKEDKDNNGAKTVTPSLTPAVWRDIAAAFDIIGHVTNEEVGNDIQRMSLTQPIGVFAAKETFGILPRRLVDPTFDRILAYVAEEIAVKTDPIQQAAIAARKSTAEAATPAQEKK